MELFKKCLAEGLGAFAIVFCGCGAVCGAVFYRFISCDTEDMKKTGGCC